MSAALSPRSGRRSVPLWRGIDDVPAEFGPCVVALGVFDGLHRGHRRLIDKARSIGHDSGLPVLLVTFDPHPARVLGVDRDTASLSTIEHRAELAADAGVDAVCVLRFTRELAVRTPPEFAQDVLADGLRATAVVVGADFTFGAGGAGSLDTLHELGHVHGFTAHGVALLQAVDVPYSSTHARACLRVGDLAGAARVLGRPHRVDGRRLGEAVRLADDTALPPPGYYRALVDDEPGLVGIDPVGWLWLLDPDRHKSIGPVTVAFLDHVQPDRWPLIGPGLPVGPPGRAAEPAAADRSDPAWGPDRVVHDRSFPGAALGVSDQLHQASDSPPPSVK